MSYKKRPELLDVIRRRGVSFEQWCSEFGLKTWDDVVAKCHEMDVTAPDAELSGPLTQLPIVGFSPEAKEELKVVLDKMHDKAEKVVQTSVTDMTDCWRLPEPQTCTRGIHDGPCNGFPSPTCKVYDEATEGPVTVEEKVTEAKKRKKKANEDES